MDRNLEIQVREFLAAADEIVTVGVREHIDTRKLVFRWFEMHAINDANDELRDRVAALLARDRQELERLQTLFSRHFQRAQSESGSSPIPRAVLRRRSYYVTAGALAAAVLLGWAYYVRWSPTPRVIGEPISAGVSLTGTASSEAQGSTPTLVSEAPSNQRPTGTTKRYVLSAARSMHDRPLMPDRFWPGDLLPLIGSFVLFLVAARLVLVAAAANRLRKPEFEARMQASRERRRALVREAAAHGEPEHVTYHVAKHALLSRREIDDAATALARIYAEESSDLLDVHETIRLTLANGRRFIPHFEPSRLSRGLLVLVDIENDDHPWLAGIERTLDELVKRGVAIIRYRFKYRPTELFPERGGAILGFEALCRRHANMPLIIVSRNLDPQTFSGDPATWVEKLKSFSRRTWIDPDPRALVGLRAARVAELERAGLTRVPFTAAGWIAVARRFAGVQTQRAVEWPALPSGTAVQIALRNWALTAALVPDATWAQLEAIRRDPLFPEIGGQLTEPFHLQLLLDWVSELTGSNAVSGDGRTLELPQDKVEQLKLEQRQRDLEGLGRPLEERALELLLRQLDPERPKGEWAQLRWQLKRASHELVLYPERAERLLCSFQGTAIEEMALEVLGPELERQRAGNSLRGRTASRTGLAKFDELMAHGNAVELGRFMLGLRSLFAREFAVAAALTLLLTILLSVVGAMETSFVRARLEHTTYFPALVVQRLQPPQSKAP